MSARHSLWLRLKLQKSSYSSKTSRKSQRQRPSQEDQGVDNLAHPSCYWLCLSRGHCPHPGMVWLQPCIPSRLVSRHLAIELVSLTPNIDQGVPLAVEPWLSPVPLWYPPKIGSQTSQPWRHRPNPSLQPLKHTIDPCLPMWNGPKHTSK